MQRLSAFDNPLLPGVETSFEATAVLRRGKTKDTKDCGCRRCSACGFLDPIQGRTHVRTHRFSSLVLFLVSVVPRRKMKMPLHFFECSKMRDPLVAPLWPTTPVFFEGNETWQLTVLFGARRSRPTRDRVHCASADLGNEWLALALDSQEVHERQRSISLLHLAMACNMVSSGWNCAAWSKGEQAKVLQLVIVSVSEYRLCI